jgi:hypothetical protein
MRYFPGQKNTPHLKRIEVAGRKGTGSYEKRYSQIEWEIVISYSPFTMNATAPDWASCAAVQGYILRTPLPAVPRRGPEAGSFVSKTIFMILR